MGLFVSVELFKVSHFFFTKCLTISDYDSKPVHRDRAILFEIGSLKVALVHLK